MFKCNESHSITFPFLFRYNLEMQNFPNTFIASVYQKTAAHVHLGAGHREKKSFFNEEM